MFGHILWQLGNWPNGIIVGNLIASVVWSSLFEWRLRVHHKAATARHKTALDELSGQVRSMSDRLRAVTGNE